MTNISDIFDLQDQHTAWMDDVRESSPIATSLFLPTGDTYAEQLAFCGLLPEDIPDVLASRDLLVDDDDLWPWIRGTAAGLIRRMGDVSGSPTFPGLKDINHPDYRFVWVHMFMLMFPHVRAFHQSRCIPDHLSRAALEDLGRNLRVHRKREGIAGLGVAWWLRLHFRGLIYQTGRLQFEIARIGNDALAESISESVRPVSANDLVFSVHIPDFCGPMTPEACDEAFADAAAFYRLYFPTMPRDLCVLHSWLADPALKDYLSPASNIIRFQDRFTIVDGEWDSTESVMQFVFGKTAADIDTVPQESSLARGVVQHIRDGNTWLGKSGWCRMPSGDHVQVRSAPGMLSAD